MAVCSYLMTAIFGRVFFLPVLGYFGFEQKKLSLDKIDLFNNCSVA